LIMPFLNCTQHLATDATKAIDSNPVSHRSLLNLLGSN
jgi:hypothetical protein